MSFELFQPLWEKFHNLSLSVQSLLTDTNTKIYIKNESTSFFQILVSHVSICNFKQFYEE